MAARKAWVVFVDNQNYLTQDHDIGNMYMPYGEEHRRLLSVFFRETHAIEAAKYLATQYPGKDVHVLKQTIGFSCQPKPVEHKEWTDEGHFIPVKS